MQKALSYSRRALSRVRASQEIWVCWHCDGCDDVSRVGDLSAEGLFIVTSKPIARVGATALVDFLVQEGALRAQAVVRHIAAGAGIGVQFTAVDNRALLRTLITRLRSPL